MATILIADDRDIDRKYLATLLGYYGHRIVQASDGVQALKEAARERPDLIISDVLMPTLDGYQFVRDLRAMPDLAHTPVIFYTASYHEREAITLARQCGVSDILTKPSEPAAIVAKVDAVLGRPSQIQEPPPPESFNEEHLRVVSDKLIEKVRDLAASEQRLAAVVSLCNRFTSQLDPIAILDDVCAAVRDVTLAEHAVVGLVSEDGTEVVHSVTSGIDAGGGSAATLPDPMVAPILASRAPVRYASGQIGHSGDGSLHGALQSFLGVPVASASRVYGWIGLRNKLGAEAFSDEDERVAGMIGTHAGIAYENAQLVGQLRRHTTTLQYAEERTRFALDAGRMGVWELNLPANHVVWSESMSSVFGIASGTGPPTLEALLDLVHQDDRRAVDDAVQHTIRTGSELATEFRVADGNHPRWVYCRGRLLGEPHSQTKRLLGVAMDVSERKSLEAQLLQAQKMEAVGQLAGGIAHDFNNMLTAILGYANLVADTLEEEDTRRECIDEVVRAAERAATLTRQLLTFSRKHVVQKGLVNVNTVVGGIRQMLGRLIGEHIQLTTLCAPDLRSVRADPGQIEQVVMNLVVNARDAMPDGGQLEIRTSNVELDESTAGSGLEGRSGPHVMLAVSDSGVGMTEDVQRRLFEPYFTTKPLGKGTGLGLATVYGIVKQSDGAIAVTSEPGRGSTVRVYFPPEEEEDMPAAPKRSTHGSLRGTERVLLVEDDAAIRHFGRTILEKAGYRVAEAADPAEAETLTAQSGDCIDLLVTDVIMPGSSGPSLFQRLAGRCPDLKVLYISGYTDDAIGGQAPMLPDFAFLQKPFSGAALRRKVRDVLDR